MKLRRRSDGAIATGFMFQSMFRPLPDWLDRYVELGKLRKPTVEAPMMVRIITGAWWPVHANDWIVAHGDDLYLIEDPDLGNTHEEV